MRLFVVWLLSLALPFGVFASFNPYAGFLGALFEPSPSTTRFATPTGRQLGHNNTITATTTVTRTAGTVLTTETSTSIVPPSDSKHRRYHAMPAKRHGEALTKRAAKGQADSGPTLTSTVVRYTTVHATSTITATATCTATRPNARAYSPKLSLNGVNIGILPDYGYSQKRDVMAGLNGLITATGNDFSTFGYYAQAYADAPFDGSQLLYVMPDLLDSGAIFEPAIMPMGSWEGFTRANNTQASRVANVLKKFTDAGVEVRLRFAHEANFYQSEGTYAGNATDFKEGWAVVAAAVKSICPHVKMFWTPNVASMQEYEDYAPDLSTVDFVGIDFYPKENSDLSTAFVNNLQGFYHRFATAWRPLAIGETGLGYPGTVEERITWIKSIIAAKSTFKYLTSVSWFNYVKEYNYRIADFTDSNGTHAFLAYLTGCEA